MGWVYETDTIIVLTGNELDDWGMPLMDNYFNVPCRVRTATDLKPIINNLGQEVVPTLTISINGAVAIKVGDTVKYGEELFKVISVKSSKDLAGNVTITKVVV